MKKIIVLLALFTGVIAAQAAYVPTAISIANGGTGATNAVSALANLGGIASTYSLGGDVTGTPAASTVTKLGNCAGFANCLSVTGATTGNNPTIAATGSDTNPSLVLNAKGTGTVVTNSGYTTQATTAATSSVPVSSPAIVFGGNGFSTGVSAAATNTIIYTPGTISGGAPSYPYNFGMVKHTFNDNSNNMAHIEQFIGSNEALSAINTQDSLGAAIEETFNTAYFGLNNISTTTASGTVPANSIYGFFAIQNTGKLGSVTPGTPGSPTFRNILDDGSGNATFVSKTTISQVVGGGSAPTMAAGAAAGTSPTCTTITGANLAGVISCTTGTATTTTGTLATITFNGTLGIAPQGCALQPRNTAAALANADIFTTAPSTTAWTIAVAGTALTASTPYSWSYSCF